MTLGETEQDMKKQITGSNYSNNAQNIGQDKIGMILKWFFKLLVITVIKCAKG